MAPDRYYVDLWWPSGFDMELGGLLVWIGGVEDEPPTTPLSSSTMDCPLPQGT